MINLHNDLDDLIIEKTKDIKKYYIQYLEITRDYNTKINYYNLKDINFKNIYNIPFITKTELLNDYSNKIKSYTCNILYINYMNNDVLIKLNCNKLAFSKNSLLKEIL